MHPRVLARRLVLVAPLTALLCAFCGSCEIGAQQPPVRNKTFFGPYDAEYSYPVAEGTVGQKDPTAVAQIKQLEALTLLPEGVEIEATGEITTGSGQNLKQHSASLAIEKGGRFRMDVENGSQVRSVRIKDGNGQAKVGDRAAGMLTEVDFGDPLSLPIHLPEIAKREDAAVIDDGVFQAGQVQLNKITVTLFHTRSGVPVAASFYFNRQTHTLEKSALIYHSITNNSQAYLKIVTYEDYNSAQSALIPLKYSETIDGQFVMALRLTSASVTPAHDESYFAFAR